MAEPATGVVDRYRDVNRVLIVVLLLNLIVALAKIVLGYATGVLSIASDGAHSIADASGNVIALVGIYAAKKPPDIDHPYGHRKYETLAAAGIVVMLLVALVQIVQAALGRLGTPVRLDVPVASFAVMLGTLVINVMVTVYERRAGKRLSSEVLLADSLHTLSDILTTLVVLGTLVFVRRGHPIADVAASLLIAGFIALAALEIVRSTTRILSDRIAIREEDIRRVVLAVPEVVGCHHIRTRGSTDYVFLDLHIWLRADTRLDTAHRLSHVVKDRLIASFPQIADAIIHVEPPPIEAEERVRGMR